MAKRFKSKDITVQEMTKDGLHNRNLATGNTERISRRIHREFDLERHSSDFLAGGKKRVLKLRRSGSSLHTKEKSGTQKTVENNRYNRDKWHSENSPSRKNRSRGQASSPHPFDAQKSSVSSRGQTAKPYTFDAQKSNASNRGQTARPYTFDAQKSDANNRAQTSRPYTFDVQKSDVSNARKQYFRDSFKTIPRTIGKVGNDVAYKEMQKESEDNKGVSAALSGARATVKGAKVVNKSSELTWKATVKSAKIVYPVVKKASSLLMKTVSNTPRFITNTARNSANSNATQATKSAKQKAAKQAAARASQKTTKSQFMTSVSNMPRFIENAAGSNTGQSAKIAKQKAAKQAAARASQEATKASNKMIQLAVSSAKAIVHSIAVAIGTIGIPFAIIIIITALFLILFQSCAIPYLNGMLGAYTAEPSEVQSSVTFMTELELALQNEIDGIEDDPQWSHIDEFDFSPGKNAMIDSITHNPIELMAYLAAVFHDFQFADVSGRIQQIFNEMYHLDYEEEEYEELVGYDDDDEPIYVTRYILHITLTKTEFLDIVMPEIESDPTRTHCKSILKKRKTESPRLK